MRTIVALLILLGFAESMYAQAAPSGVVPGDPALAYWIMGRGSPTIVVLHGGPAIPHDYLRPEWERLAAMGRTVFYDQRGCGQSPSRMLGSFRWQDHVADLHRLLDLLAPKEQVVLAGSSWGVHLALLYARAHPERVRALILSGAVPWELLTLHPPSASRNQPPLPPSPSHRVHPLEGKICEWAHNLTRQSLTSMPRLGELRSIRAPALFLRGAGEYRDLPDGTEEIARALPNVRITTLPRGDHSPWSDDPTRFFSEVRRFLCELPASATK